MFRCGMATPRTRADVICIHRLARHLSCGPVDQDFLSDAPSSGQRPRCAHRRKSPQHVMQHLTGLAAPLLTPSTVRQLVGTFISDSISVCRWNARCLTADARPGCFNGKVEGAEQKPVLALVLRGTSVTAKRLCHCCSSSILSSFTAGHGVSPIYPEGRPHALDVRLRASLC